MTQTALYRHFDAEGRLLYIGIAKNALRRLSQHATAPWAQDVRTIKVEMFASREDALTAEGLAIRAEKPLHNRNSGAWRLSVPEAPTERPFNPVLAEINAFLAVSGMKATVFGLKAVNDGKLVGRLEAGSECLPRTAAKIRAFIATFIAQNPPQSREMQRAS